MSDNIKIRVDKNSLLDYIKDLQEGKIQVPGFQRDFKWTRNQKIELLDSIEKGYPIGSILFWNPNFQKKEISYDFEPKRIGSYEIPKKDRDFFYILDGFQRLSTLFGCLINPHKTQLTRNRNEWKEFNIVYNLEAEEGKYNFELYKSTKPLPYYKIPVYSLIDPKDFFNFQRILFQLNLKEEKIEEYLRKFENVSKRLQLFEIPVINIYGGTIAEAVDIFQRLNSKGAPITADWIVSALSFSKDFKLGAEINKLLENIAIYNFKKIQRKIILQCITNSFGGAHFDTGSKGKKLEELARRNDFIDISRKTLRSIDKSVKFLFEELLVLNSKLLPYNNQLIFITDFFNQIEHPTTYQLETLKKWFWTTTYANYFTIYNLSKQRLAYNKFQAFLQKEEESPIYYDSPPPFTTIEFPSKISMKSVRAKALALFLLDYQIKNRKIPLEVASLEGYKAYKLFSSEENSSENTILVINDGTHKINKFQKDLSDWLTSDEDHTAFFITNTMKKIYKKGSNQKSILEMRKKLIMGSEEAFVKNLGLKYFKSTRKLTII